MAQRQLGVEGFDDDPIVRHAFHEFVADKPAWYAICDGAKQLPAHPTKS